MAVQDKKVSDLTPLVNVTSDDLLMVVNDPNGSPTSRKISLGNLFGNVNINTAFTAGLTVRGTNVFTGINDKLQVANATVLFNEKLSVSNAIVLAAQTVTNSVAAAGQLTRTTDQIIFSANVINGVIANTVYANTTVSAEDTMIIRSPSADPATSNASVEGITAGSMFYSNSYFYIATSNNTIKRIALQDF